MKGIIKEKVTDRLFIQEIINDLHRNGFCKSGKADVLLRDWSRELKGKTGMTGRTKKVFFSLVGKEQW